MLDLLAYDLEPPSGACEAGGAALGEQCFDEEVRLQKGCERRSLRAFLTEGAGVVLTQSLEPGLVSESSMGTG